MDGVHLQVRAHTVCIKGSITRHLGLMSGLRFVCRSWSESLWTKYRLRVGKECDSNWLMRHIHHKWCVIAVFEYISIIQPFLRRRMPQTMSNLSTPSVSLFSATEFALALSEIKYTPSKMNTLCRQRPHCYQTSCAESVQRMLCVILVKSVA